MQKLTACLISAFILIACKKGTDPVTTPPEPVPALTINKTSLAFEGDNNVIDSFSIQFSGKWTLTIPSEATWIKSNVTSGTGNTKIFITTQERNSTGTKRVATVKVSVEGGANSVNVIVMQDKYSSIKWQKVFGGSGYDHFNQVIPCPDGGYIAIGSVHSADGDVSELKGAIDVFVVKTNAEGNKIWAKTYGGFELDEGLSIALAHDGGYILSGATHYSPIESGINYHGDKDIWVVKIDANGNVLWQKAFGGSSIEQGYSIIATSDGNYVVAGGTYSHNGDVTNNHGNENAWLLKIDGTGNVLWQKAYGGNIDNRANSILETPDGGYVAVGYNGNSVASGDVGPSQAVDAWVFKVDKNGNLLWEKSVGGPGYEEGRSISATSDGGFIVAGYSIDHEGTMGIQGDTDAWIVKIDANGNTQWERVLGGSAKDDGTSVTPVSDGYVVTAYTSSVDGDVVGNHGLRDAWVLKFDISGNLVWKKAFGGSEDEIPTSILSIGNNTFLMAGYTASQDGDSEGTHGRQDAWLFTFKIE